MHHKLNQRTAFLKVVANNMLSYTKLASVILGSFYILSNVAHSSFSADPFCSITQTKNITKCKKLTTLEAEFGWNYQIYNKTFTQVDILFSVRQHKEEIRWLAWGVNPGNRPEMVGTRAIIGIIQRNGILEVRTYNITTYTKLGCVLFPTDIDLEVRNKSGESTSEYITIYATLILPDQFYNITRLNHVWQVGHSADGLEPMIHPLSVQNFDSTETINLKSGDSHDIEHYHRHIRMVHGILNIVGWGTILPIGVIVTRYCRGYPLKWKYYFHFHVSCQIVGYILGTTGWGIGLWLGQASTKYTFSTHRLISIFIFTLTTLQVFALRLKPEERDDYRKYWDMYHHFLGYALLALIVVNIFQGIAILRSENKIWKWAYIGILGILAFVVLTCEVLTWIVFIKKRNKDKNAPVRPPISPPISPHDMEPIQ